MRKKVLSFLLAAVLMCSFMAMTVSAAQVDAHDHSACTQDDTDLVARRAVPCYSCPNGFYRYIGNNQYRCDRCGDVVNGPIS